MIVIVGSIEEGIVSLVLLQMITSGMLLAMQVLK